MAPSIFKPSCGFFILIWMISLSMMSGMHLIMTRYTVLAVHPNFQIPANLMEGICIVVTVMALLGCCSIKLDVTHICCVVLYGICTILATLVMASFVFHLLRDFDKGMLTPAKMIRIVRSEFDEKRLISEFLHLTQIHHSCCGIFGFKDYRAFILPAGMNMDVPYSCCKNADEGVNKTCRTTWVPKLENVTLPSSSTIDLDGQEGEDEAEEQEEALVKMEDPSALFNIFNTTGTQGIWPKSVGDIKKLRPNSSLLLALYGERAGKLGDGLASNLSLPIKPLKIPFINHRGCYDLLKVQSDRLVGVYFSFCVFILLCSFIMVFLYVRHCLAVRRAAKEVQELISQVTPVGTNSDKGKRDTSSIVLEANLQQMGGQSQILQDLQSPKKKLIVSSVMDLEGKGPLNHAKDIPPRKIGGGSLLPGPLLPNSRRNSYRRNV